MADQTFFLVPGGLPYVLPTLAAESEKEPHNKGFTLEDVARVVTDAITSVLPFGKSDVKQTSEETPTPAPVATDWKAKLKDRAIFVFKAANGRYAFVCRYSNNFRDDDYPREIISGDSHKRFVTMVDAGLAPLPELWLFHEPAYKCGESVMVAVDESEDGAVWALAFGYFDEDKSAIAEALMNSPIAPAMSHGMPYDTIQYERGAWDTIVQHETREISVLPREYAANKLTEFYTVILEDNPQSKEGNLKMAIDPNKKNALIAQFGIPKDSLDALEQLNAEQSKAATLLRLDKKEATPAPVAEIETEPVTETETEAEETTPVTEETPLTRSEIADAVSEALAPILETQATLTSALLALQENVKGLQKQATELAASQAANDVGGLATNTLSALISENIKTRTAVGAGETKVDATDPLATSKPTETKTRKSSLSGLIARN